MDETEREDVFLASAALGTDLVTSYVAADEAERPRKPAGCLPALLGSLVVMVVTLAAMLAL